MARIECRFDPDIPWCKYCFSTNVTLDGSAAYDPKTKEWYLVTTYDSGGCSDCGEEHRWFPTLADLIETREGDGEDVKKT